MYTTLLNMRKILFFTLYIKNICESHEGVKNETPSMKGLCYAIKPNINSITSSMWPKRAT